MRLLITIITLVLFGCSKAPQEIENTILPKPKTRQTTGELLDLSKGFKVEADKMLEPLDEMIKTDFHLLTGIQIKRVSDIPTLKIQIDNDLPVGNYTIETTGNISIKGSSYTAVVNGISSLWQSLNANLHIPKGTIKDSPNYNYRSIMLDLARAWHDIETIKEIIMLCRWYKINYLHLHLTDDSAFTFPSDAFPALATKGHSYSKEELIDLNQYAQERGVILIPEIDVPGHSSEFIKKMPELFGIAKVDNNPYTVSMGKEEVYEALAVLMKEVAAVFSHSPYIHIGGDEAFFEGMEDDPETMAYMKKHNVPNLNELFRHFLVRLNEMVKATGKQTIVWAGFGEEGELEIPKDVIVLLWESVYHDPQALIKDGYFFINASFKPLYVVNNRKWSPEYIYKEWTPKRWESWSVPEGEFLGIEIQDTDLLMGATMCAWEQGQINQLPRLRKRVASMSEHLWNPTKDWKDFEKRQLAADAKLSKLLRPFEVDVKGLTYTDLGEGNFYEHLWFDNEITVTVKAAFEGLDFKYAITNRPSKEDWKKLKEPIKITETTYLRIQAFDAKGKKLGRTYLRRFFFKPISIQTQGLVKELPIGSWDKMYFEDSLMISLLSEKENHVIRYNTNGRSVTDTSTIYTHPFSIDVTSHLQTQLFNENGERVGSSSSASYLEMWSSESLTTGKKTWSSNEATTPGSSRCATDGKIALWEHWGDHNDEENWVKVDLGKLETISKFKVVTFWDNYRYYQYTIEGSKDGENWTTILDKSRHTELSTEKGYVDEIEAVELRFLKINLLFNSANPGLHLVEFGAYN